MRIKSIHNEKDYDNVLDRVDELMEFNPGLATPESDELEMLVLLLERYEEKEWAVSDPNPIDAFAFRSLGSTEQINI